MQDDRALPTPEPATFLRWNAWEKKLVWPAADSVAGHTDTDEQDRDAKGQQMLHGQNSLRSADPHE